MSTFKAGRRPVDKITMRGFHLVTVLVAVVLVAAVQVAVVLPHRRAALRRFAAVAAELEADNARRVRVEESLRTRDQELTAFTDLAAQRLRDPLIDLGAALAIATDQVRQGDTADALVMLDRAHTRSRVLARLVTDLLLLSSISEITMRFTQVDLVALVADVLRRLEADHPGVHDLVEVGQLPEVFGDPALLDHLITRLVENALVFAVPGGSPRVTISADLSGSGWRGEEWRIEVRDRGVGIPDAERSAIFEPFRPIAGPDPRTGNRISLAVSRKIVLRHRGDIGVEANPGGGSVFWFSLPVRMNRRRFPRVENVDGAVVLTCPSGTAAGRIVDMSEGGLRFLAERPLIVPAGAGVTLHIEMGGQVHRQLATTLPPRRDAPAGEIRVVFIDPQPGLVEVVRALVDMTDTQPEPLLSSLQSLPSSPLLPSSMPSLPGPRRPDEGMAAAPVSMAEVVAEPTATAEPTWSPKQQELLGALVSEAVGRAVSTALRDGPEPPWWGRPRESGRHRGPQG